ncbi:IclR family transcriptional regulator C-terminal domain-containing protein [Streptomyces sp. NPDC101115]|uniref:IclR family transcriptional regulator domain-containing protein n=1 Tax=Streptomyces sp. NPDC101115 TaxID=3366106 RepID=UPI0038247CC2
MSENTEIFRSMEDVLATVSAGSSSAEPDRAASRARLLARAAGLAHGTVTTLNPGPDAEADAHADENLLDADEAGLKLEAVCAGVVLASTAGAALAVFAEHAAADPDGALVFACLLHLTGEAEGATFWWQLAAGAELPLAAYCLFLDHSRRGEYDDAMLWARRLTDAGTLDAVAGDSPLPPPRLRIALARLSRSWAPQHVHEDLGAIPMASPGLAKVVFMLAHRTKHPAPGSWMVSEPAKLTRPPKLRPAASGPAVEPGGTQVLPSEPATSSAPPEAPEAEGSGTPPATSTGFSALPLRHTTLTALAQQVPVVPHAPDQWAAAMRVLDVLHAVRGARRPLPMRQIATAAGLDGVDLTRLMQWLCRHRLLDRLPDGAYIPGPLFAPTPAGDPLLRHDALTGLLDELRDTTGAAIYLSRYTDGEVTVQHCSDSPATPAIIQYVDLREAAHASANGKCLMAQLPFDSRMDHLARHRPYALTDRTITDPAALFRALDGHGPHASQFDVLEYSQHEVCVAVPVTLDGRPACIALSLPVAQKARLLGAARTLSERSGLILLTLLAMLPTGSTPAPAEHSDPRCAAPAPNQRLAVDWQPSTTRVRSRAPSGILLPTVILAPGWASSLTSTR